MPDEAEIAADAWIHFKTTGKVSRNERNAQKSLAEKRKKPEEQGKLVQGILCGVPNLKWCEKPVKLFRRNVNARPRQQEGTREEYRNAFPEKFE